MPAAGDAPVVIAGEQLVTPEANPLGGVTGAHASPFFAFALGGAALLVALIALAVALFK